MRLGETTYGGAAVVKAEGRIDAACADAFRDALLASLSASRAGIVVDMGQVDHISSAGLRALMLASKTAKADGKALAISDLTSPVLEIFTIGGFNLIFSIHAGVREALSAVAPDGLPQFDAS
jgi:anti-anti-sigma factor